MLWCVVPAGAFKYLTVGLDKLDTLEIEGKLGEFREVTLKMAPPSAVNGKRDEGTVESGDALVLQPRECFSKAKKYKDVEEDGKGKCWIGVVFLTSQRLRVEHD